MYECTYKVLCHKRIYLYFATIRFLFVQVLPLFYVLMSRKTAHLYTKVFKYIEKKLFKMSPSSFMTDFELGMRKAIRDVYPNAILNGCWYHYCAAIRKKLVELGLYKQIKDTESNVRVIYRMILSLPLLPSEMFIDGCKFIRAEAQTLGLQNIFKSFFAYFQRYWINTMVCL